MAAEDIAVAAALQPAHNNVPAAKRAREFYRYLQPDNLVQPHLVRRPSTVEAYNDTVPSLSAALSPFCQLTAMRLHAPKALLNVMDKEVMYFLAEASCERKVIGDQETYEFFDDPIMMACSSTPMRGRICELTLELSKGDNVEVPMFTIEDLSKSEFAQLGPIAGPPFYRFYAGTPITTSNGINIGSLAIMDTKLRPALSTSEVEFLGRTAAQIMTYLETNRQAIEGRRARRLAEGLESFIAGKKSLRDESLTGIVRRPSTRRKGKSYGVDMTTSQGHFPTSPKKPARPATLKAKPSTDSIASGTDGSELSNDEEQQKSKDIESESRSHAKTFARAANLLRESFGDLGDDGAVIFMSLKSRLNQPSGSTLTERQRNQSGQSGSNMENGNKSAEGARPNFQGAEMLACSTWDAPLATSEDAGAKPAKLSEDMLRDLMRRYSGGKLWSVDDSWRSSSSEDDSIVNGDRGRPPEQSKRGSRRRKDELEALFSAFPNARQVLFAPVWDASVGSFQQAVFVLASSDTRTFSATTELSFLNSYCSTVMAECSRIDTVKADTMKSDFVGTISHEMRSPLHGILASAEFLADTELSTFQEGLVDTIESCGRTLLDTINHVLDFSKVNSFQKHWEASNKRTSYLNKKKHYLGPDNTSKPYSHGAPPLLQLFAVTDISAVLEEVVDGLVLGQTYSSGVDMLDMSREARGRGKKNTQSTDLPQDDVQVVLDVQQADWAFLTQPGAVRRIILNLTGNALKYTSHGSITICLDLRKDEAEDTVTMLLRVTDTGKGISKDFLSTKLFVPFAQENALAPGTGLGMSIVHSIVTMLGGTIDVKSQLGEGTTVEVALPVQRPLPGHVSTTGTPHSGGTGSSGASRPDESLQLLQNQGADSRVVYYRRERTLTNDKLYDIVCRYVRDWYGLEVVDPQLIASANVIIVEEEDLEDLMARIVGTPGQKPVLVVLCSVASRHSGSYTSALERRIDGALAFVSKPVGPYKLAKSMRMALQKLKTIKPQFRDVVNLGVIHERDSEGPTPLTFAGSEPDSVAERLQEMDLSPRDKNPNTVVQASETMSISQISQNAQMAINSPPPKIKTPSARPLEGGAFPFPSQDIIEQEEEQTPKRQIVQFPEESAFTPTRRQRTASMPQTNGAPLVNPRILLVDDNKINLKLLQTYLKNKRKYSRIELAEDGEQAVDVFTLNSSLGDGYEIVFMDISMPVMNGFEATRAIREYEEQNSDYVGKGAMVIALTGLASGKDQAEGFDAGVDIYLTKPVSFKEVGKLLDNWEAHQKLKDISDVPDALRTGLNLDKNNLVKDMVSPSTGAKP